MRKTAFIITLAAFAVTGAAVAGQPNEQAYYYGLTGNDWWVAKAHLSRPVAPRADVPANTRAPWASSVGANGQGTN